MTRMLGTLVANPTTGSDGVDERPYIALEHVSPGRGRLLEGIQLETVTRTDAVLCEPGDVLFGKLRPYLAKVVVPEEPSFCSSELLVLRPRDGEMHPRFLYYLCLSKPLVHWAIATSDGVKMPRTDWSSLRQLRIEAPDIETQAAIAARLDAEVAVLDRLTAECVRQLELLQERRQAEVDGLLVHGLDESRLRTAHIPWPVRVPRDWDVMSLRYCTDRITVGIVVNPSHYYVDDGVPCLRGLNVRPGRTIDEPLVYMSEESNQLHGKSILRRGDIVVVRTGAAGAAAVVPEWAVGGNAIDLLIVTPGARFRPKFLELLLNSDFVQQQVAIGSVGALQAHFNVAALDAVKVVCPPVEEQDPIVARVEDALGRLDGLRNELELQLRLIDERREAVITSEVMTHMGEAAA